MNVVRRSRDGFTLIELLIVIAVIAILAAMAIPNLRSSRKSADEASAVDSIRAINSAEAAFRSRNSAFADMSSLASANLIDPALGAATATSNPRSGYFFGVFSIGNSTYFVVSSPVGNSGDREFYSDERGVIYGAPVLTPFPATDTNGAIPAGFAQIGN